MASPTRRAPEDEQERHHEQQQPGHSFALLVSFEEKHGATEKQKGNGDTGGNVERTYELHPRKLASPPQNVKSQSGD